MTAIAAALALMASFATLRAEAQTVAEPTATVPSAQTVDTAPWLYKGSDIPQDKGWQFGTLPNGLRYAVRANGAPPGQVAIRVRVDAGSLVEGDTELGFAHFLEHLSFRGSRYVEDGEAKRIWQRLGAAFGSDTNANTSPTATVYQLDIPSATTTGLSEAMRVLSGMVRAPNLDKATIDSERSVVLAELRESAGPQSRIADAQREHLFAGQRLASRLPIGTEATLKAANRDTLTQFHERWYRPENVVIAIAGDGDPAVYARLIQQNFADWAGKGVAAIPPPFGDPVPGGSVAQVIVEPTSPLMVTLNYARPWRQVTDTVAYTHQLYVDYIAASILNRRLENSARAGGSYVFSQVQEDKVARSAVITGVNIVPIGDDWQAAVKDVRGVIADALTTPPTQAEIDREYQELEALMTREVENAQNESGADLVNDLLEAVDIRETATDPVNHRELFRGSKSLATPQSLLATTRKLFSGKVMRALLVSPKPLSGAEPQLASLVSATVAADATARTTQRKVSFADLPKFGVPGAVSASRRVPGLDLDVVSLSNGVNALILNNDIEPDKIRVRVRFGGGRQALSPTAPNLLWTGNLALVESGIGKLDLLDLEALTNGRLIGMNFGVDDDAFEFSAETNARDLPDQLKLIAAKIANPGWDAAPVRRARSVQLQAFETANASPGSVLERDLQQAMRPGDKRWSPPSREQIDALTPESFKAFWAPLLANGPIEVQLFGDMSKVDANALLAQTFGAIAPRTAIASRSTATLSFPTASNTPTVLRHSGDANQAAAILAWPTSGGIDNIREERQLNVLAAIFNDRLFDRLRAKEGAAYSPSVDSSWPRNYANGGFVMAASLVQPEAIPGFYRLAREIAAELVSTPVEADELSRAIKPIRELIYRASSGNAFFMNELEGASSDPRKFTALRSYLTDTESTTPADVQALARKYLLPSTGWSLQVLPKDAPIVAASAKAPAEGAR